MELNMYSVLDVKAEAYVQPWFAPTHGVAERMFARAAMDEENNIAQNPEDFSLWHVGIFDQSTGLVQQVTPTMLTQAHLLPKREGFTNGAMRSIDSVIQEVTNNAS